MSGSKVYVKKPLRRYERAFDEVEKEAEETDANVEPEVTPSPDITSPAGIAPIMAAKKQPVRYKVRQDVIKKIDHKKQGEDGPGKKKNPE